MHNGQVMARSSPENRVHVGQRPRKLTLAFALLAAACSGGDDVTLLAGAADVPPPNATQSPLEQDTATAAGLDEVDPAGGVPITPGQSIEDGSQGELLSAACGSGSALADDGRIARKPYLQSVTATSAVIVFTTRDPDVEPSVHLSQPGGVELPTRDTELDPSDPGHRQRLVRLSGLAPGAAYCYRVGRGPVVGFRTPPRAGTGSLVRFVAFGDSGGDARDEVRAALDGVPFDLILHTGDIAYQTGTLAEFEAKFFDTYAGLLARAPFFPASGNHDYAADQAASFRQVFVLPENGAPDGVERWYSFGWGDVHFVALDTEQVNDAQTEWLERDLAANSLPWTIAYLHRPPFSSGAHGGSPGVREAFTPVFEAYGVALVLAGHDHDYERTRAIGGVTYVVTGGGGYSVRSVGTSDFTALSAARFHFVQGEVRGDTLTLSAVDASGERFDGLTLTRRPDPR